MDSGSTGYTHYHPGIGENIFCLVSINFNQSQSSWVALSQGCSDGAAVKIESGELASGEISPGNAVTNHSTEEVAVDYENTKHRDISQVGWSRSSETDYSPSR